MHVVLRQAIGGINDSFSISDVEYNDNDYHEENDSVSEMELSMGQMTIDDPQDITSSTNFFSIKKFKVPPLLTRHPPPAIGRDDDLNKLQHILDEVLVKSGICQDLYTL